MMIGSKSAKMLLQLLFISILFCDALGEPPVEVVPYAAAGWRPRIPFNLPGEGEYVTSYVFEEPQPVDVEFSRERVNFVGQIGGNTRVTTKEPQSAYLPPSFPSPSDADVIITQALPNNNPTVGFRPPTPRPSVRPTQRPNSQQNFNAQSQFGQPQPQYTRPQRPYPQQNVFPSSNPTQSQFGQPQPQYTRPQRPYPQQNVFPSSNPAQSQFGQPQPQYTRPQRPYPQENINSSSNLPQTNILSNTTAETNTSRQPAEEYGPPPPTLNNNTPFTIIYPSDVDPRTLNDSEDNKDDDVADLPQPRTTIEGLNAAIDEYYKNLNNQNNSDPSQPKRTNIEGLNAAIDEFYKRQREREFKERRGDQNVNTLPYSNLNEGRYYILTPENTLQRVSYKTGQDAEDARANGFTAQLKYATVGEVKDPIYKYNNQGQLVRVLK